MNTEQILMCVVALILGMLLANMLKSVCGCKNIIEGSSNDEFRAACANGPPESRPFNSCDTYLNTCGLEKEECDAHTNCVLSAFNSLEGDSSCKTHLIKTYSGTPFALRI